MRQKPQTTSARGERKQKVQTEDTAANDNQQANKREGSEPRLHALRKSGEEVCSAADRLIGSDGRVIRGRSPSRANVGPKAPPSAVIKREREAYLTQLRESERTREAKVSPATEPDREKIAETTKQGEEMPKDVRVRWEVWSRWREDTATTEGHPFGKAVDYL